MAAPDEFNPLLQHFALLIVSACIFCLFTFLFPHTIFAKEETAFEEITVFLNVPGLGGKELEAIIKKEEVYLSVTDLFEFLKIKNKLSSDLDSVTGFFLSENNTYVIDKKNNQIILQGKIYALSADDLIQTLAGLYLKSTVFGKVFGLECIFNFRNLSINLTTKLDLPAFREKRQELMRQNISKLKRELIADTTIHRKYPAFNFGTADWSLTSIQQGKGVANAMMNLKLGTIVAGGETNVSINYDTYQDFNLKQQNYLWRYANNDKKILKQVMAGKIYAQSTASLLAPVVGLQITNTPTTFRRSFGTYTLSDFTEPEWIAELYINNVLIDYVKADASGFFSFQVPMVYGNSVLKTRFFGPGGEERTKEQNINVPYNFLPKNELEYTLSAGILEDGKQSRFSRVDVKYGLNPRITIGSGVEYLSSVASDPIMPFINGSFRLASNLFLSADYTYGVRARAIVNYRMPSDLLFELNYTKYKEGQQAIYNNLLEERKAILSKRFRGHNFSGFTRLTINQIIYSKTKQTIADLLLSGTVMGISTNLTTYALIMNKDYLNIYSNLSLAFRLPRRYVLRPQVQYGYINRNINSLKVELEKQLLGNGALHLTYDNNFKYNTQSFSLGLRFDLSFMRASFSALQTNNRTIFTQSLRGGSIYDGKTNYFNFNNRNNTGRGGLVIYPYLDINSNNHRDAGEPKIEGLKLKINGGRIQNNIRDTTIQIFDLEPYTSYLLELNRNSFDNIAWQLKNATFKVTIDPNKLKLIEVPVNIKGEASGMVYASTSDSTGQGRIIVNFYRNGSTLVGRTLTESDGYFSLLDLAPGSYTACVDSVQLSKLQMTVVPASKSFNIATMLEGDVVSNIEFKLQSLSVETPIIDKLIPSKIKTEEKDSTTVNVPFQASTLATTASAFSIRISVMGDSTRALINQKYLIEKFGHPVKLVFEGTTYYQLNLLGFSNKQDAEKLLPDLRERGFTKSYVVSPRYFKPAEKTINKLSSVINTYTPVIEEIPSKVNIPPPATTNKIPSVPHATKRNPKKLYPVTTERFLVVVGKTTDESATKLAQQLIFKTLNATSISMPWSLVVAKNAAKPTQETFKMQDAALFPLYEGNSVRLVITGFKDLNSAEKAHKKLIAAGLKEGYIKAYKEKSLKILFETK